MPEREKSVDPVAFSRFLRKHKPLAEQVLADALSDKKTGYKFITQHRIGAFYVDFCCRSHKVVVEVDGEVHEGREEEDMAREAKLSDAGFLVLRFENDEVINHLDRVVAKIKQVCDGRPQWRF